MIRLLWQDAFCMRHHSEWIIWGKQVLDIHFYRYGLKQKCVVLELATVAATFWLHFWTTVKAEFSIVVLVLQLVPKRPKQILPLPPFQLSYVTYFNHWIISFGLKKLEWILLLFCCLFVLCFFVTKVPDQYYRLHTKSFHWRWVEVEDSFHSNIVWNKTSNPGKVLDSQR